jgi:hypothetical protein
VHSHNLPALRGRRPAGAIVFLLHSSDASDLFCKSEDNYLHNSIDFVLIIVSELMKEYFCRSSALKKVGLCVNRFA